MVYGVTLICSLLKLETPMDLTSPFFTSSSMASQVVVGWVSSNLEDFTST